MRYNWDSSGQHFCTNPYSTGRRRRASSWNRNQWKRYYLWLNYSFLIENPPKHEQQYGNNVRFGRWVVVDPRPDLSPTRRTNQRGGIGSNGWSWKKGFYIKVYGLRLGTPTKKPWHYWWYFVETSPSNVSNTKQAYWLKCSEINFNKALSPF